MTLGWSKNQVYETVLQSEIFPVTMIQSPGLFGVFFFGFGNGWTAHKRYPYPLNSLKPHSR